MLPPKELRPEEFTERLEPLFREILQEGGLAFAPESFFGRWRHYMELGLARTWESCDSALGAFFTTDLFGNQLRGQVAFFFALPSVRGTPVTKQLFQAFEAAAKESGCVDVLVSAHEGGDAVARAASYEKNGFIKLETVYKKVF